MWKKILALILVAGLPLAWAQGARAQSSAQPAVKWTLQVLQDGTQVDSFDATTTIGQSYNGTHRRSVTHDIGCQNRPAAQIELARTITVSPLRLDDQDAVTFALETQETLEENDTPRTAEGCKLPPQPRRIHAVHPGLTVRDGQWSTWQIVDKNPSLAYRLRADVVGAAHQ